MAVGKPGSAERNQAVHPRRLDTPPAAILLLVFQYPANRLLFGPLADRVGRDAVIQRYNGLFQQRQRFGQADARRRRHRVIGVFRPVRQQFVNPMFRRDAPHRAARRDNRQRHNAAARPAGKPINAERRPVGHEHHLRQQARRPVPLPLPQQRQPYAREHPDAGQPALGHNKLPGPPHILRIRGFPAEFQREIAFHSRRKVAGRAVVNRPRPVGALLAPQVIYDVPLPFRVMPSQETA